VNNLHIITLYKLHKVAGRAHRVELVVSSVSSCAIGQTRHSQYAWRHVSTRQNACRHVSTRHVERVESCRVETWRAKWNFEL